MVPENEYALHISKEVYILSCKPLLSEVNTKNSKAILL